MELSINTERFIENYNKHIRKIRKGVSRILPKRELKIKKNKKVRFNDNIAVRYYTISIQEKIYKHQKYYLF